MLISASYWERSRGPKPARMLGCLRGPEGPLFHSVCCVIAFGLVSVVLCGVGFAQAPTSRAGSVNDPALDARVESLLRQMTVEEKIGQLVQYSAGQPTGPGTGRSDYDDMLARGQVGSMFNVIEPREINKYQKIAMEKARLHIPILFGLD